MKDFIIFKYLPYNLEGYCENKITFSDGTYINKGLFTYSYENYMQMRREKLLDQAKLVLKPVKRLDDIIGHELGSLNLDIGDQIEISNAVTNAIDAPLLQYNITLQASEVLFKNMYDVYDLIGQNKAIKYY